VYGATVCTLTCSPFIAGYIVGSDRGVKRGLWLSVIFNAGRVLTYGALGLAVGLAGSAFLVDGAYAGWGALAFGGTVAAIGLWIAVRRRPGGCGRVCADGGTPNLVQRMRYRLEPREGEGGELSAGLMGLLIGLVPCPPLIALLVFAGSTGSAATGMAMGVLFGLGTVISPILIVAGAAGWFSDRIARESPTIRPAVMRLAGLLLVVLGVWSAYRALTGDGGLL
jgi:sulfite exporter TauE/SafE